MSLGNFRGINGAHLRIYEPGKLLMVKICSNVKMRAHANFQIVHLRSIQRSKDNGNSKFSYIINRRPSFMVLYLRKNLQLTKCIDEYKSAVKQII